MTRERVQEDKKEKRIEKDRYTLKRKKMAAVGGTIWTVGGRYKLNTRQIGCEREKRLIREEKCNTKGRNKLRDEHTKKWRKRGCRRKNMK